MTQIDEPNLDEQIEKVIELSHRAGFLQGSGLSFIEDKGKSYNEAKKAMQALIATQAILSDLLQIIGEDEIDNFPDIHEIAPRLRNQLRQELREMVRKYCE